MSHKEDKQYGLILPQKRPTIPQAGNIFGNEDGSDEEDGTTCVKRALRAEEKRHKLKRQTKLDMQKALAEDPTIYQYDEVYDDIVHTKLHKKSLEEKEKKPKYIQSLLKAAERRKKEQEHRIERMVQKERETEGSMFADKESFVTSAYRAKLEEFKKMEEEDVRLSALEAIEDVTKQQDISGFYRYLYERTVESSESFDVPHILGEDEQNRAKVSDIQRKNDDTPMQALKIGSVQSFKTQNNIANNKKYRQYRQRNVENDQTDSSSDSIVDTVLESVNVVHITNENLSKMKTLDSNGTKPEEKTELNTPNISVVSIIKNKTNCENSDKETRFEDDNCEKVSKSIAVKDTQKENKSCIWQKRTVDTVFEAALQRYYTRKALKTAII